MTARTMEKTNNENKYKGEYVSYNIFERFELLVILNVEPLQVTSVTQYCYF